MKDKSEIIKLVSSTEFAREHGWTIFNGNEIETIGIPSEFFDDDSLPSKPTVSAVKMLSEARELGLIIEEIRGEKYVECWRIK